MSFLFLSTICSSNSSRLLITDRPSAATSNLEEESENNYPNYLARKLCLGDSLSPLLGNIDEKVRPEYSTPKRESRTYFPVYLALWIIPEIQFDLHPSTDMATERREPFASSPGRMEFIPRLPPTTCELKDELLRHQSHLS